MIGKRLIPLVGLVGAALIILWMVRISGGDTAPDRPRIEVSPLEAFHATVTATVQPGDTLESMSRRLAGRDWPRWRTALSEEIDPRALLPGTRFSGRLSPSDRLASLVVTLDLRTEVHLEKSGGTVLATKVERPIHSEIVRFEGVIESSLFGAIDTIGASPELAVRMADIFQWDIDFLRDIRQGDQFVAVVEKRSVDGEFFGYGTLYGARLVNNGKEINTFAFADADGAVGYYDLDGAPVKKQFLRSPLKFSRITSRFSLNRFHPVHKKRMPHYGVDYGAPTGTPAHATATGTVTFVGRNGGAGNMVRVRHSNGYETNYLHLSRFAKGIRKGARVSQGQVVGYVGSTGWSTGPHLDYRVKKNGRWVNPLLISSPPADPLPETLLRRYLAHALAMLEVMEGREPPPGARC
ncbi:MAG: peptidoglycan DD-metalloendopeptidase family protein [Acidobacteriota bacterium]